MIKRLAIIPARAGSKRIKNKNMKLFFGKPLIYYSIKAALDSKFLIKFIFRQTQKKLLITVKNLK